MRCADIGRSYTIPLRIEPEVGQRPANGSNCPNKSPFVVVASSHRPFAESSDAIGTPLNCLDTTAISSAVCDVPGLGEVVEHLVRGPQGCFGAQVFVGGPVSAGRQDGPHVLQEHQSRAQDPDRFRDHMPQPRPVPGLESRPEPGR
jgi:hypothetical protein